MGPPSTASSSRDLRVARLCWLVVAVASTALALAAFVALLDQGAATGRVDSGPLSVKPELVTDLVDLGVLSDGAITAGDVVIRVVGLFLFVGIALVLAWRGGRDPVRLLFSAALLLLATSLFAPLTTLARVEPGLAWLTATVGVFTPTAPEFWRSLTGLGLLFLLCVFPDGRFVPSWTSRALAALAALVALWTLFPGSRLDPAAWPGPLRATGLLALPFAGLAAQLWRYRQAGAEARRQMRLVVLALGTITLAFAVLAILDPELEEGVGELVVATPRLQALYELQLLLVLTAALFLLPVSIAVSVLRYRLLDIDIVVNRAVIYGLLAAFIGAVYVAVVVVVGAVVGSSGEPDPALAVLTLVVVAFSVDVVRRQAERFANRLVYGERATPYEMMADFSHGLSRALSSDDVLPRVAEAAAQGTRGVGGRATLHLDGARDRLAHWPDESVSGLVFATTHAVRFQGEVIGELAVSAHRGDPHDDNDRAVLAALADQAAPALHNLTLDARLEASAAILGEQTEELQASRRRLVTAREDAVGRLVAEVEERVEQAMVDARRGLVVAAARLGAERETALALVEEAAGSVRSALDALREIAHGVYPPVLAARGLPAAIGTALDRLGLEVEFDGRADSAARYDPDVEASVYFCVVEAIHELERAGATRARVELHEVSGPAEATISFVVSGSVPGGPVDADRQLLVDQVGAMGGTLAIEEEMGRLRIEGRIASAGEEPDSVQRGSVP